MSNHFKRNKDVENKPMSIEQAGNYLEEKNQQDLREDLQQNAALPISSASPQECRQYLNYALELLKEKPQYNAHRKFLEMRVNGASLEEIARGFKVKVDTVRRLEKDSIKLVQDLIRSKRENAIPLFEKAFN